MTLGTLALHAGRLVTVIAIRVDGLVVVSYRIGRKVEILIVEERDLIIVAEDGAVVPDLPIGQAIAHVRRQRGLRQCDLAKQAHVALKTVCFIEQGRRYGSPDVLQAIGRVLNIDLYPLWQQVPVQRRREWQ